MVKEKEQQQMLCSGYEGKFFIQNVFFVILTLPFSRALHFLSIFYGSVIEDTLNVCPTNDLAHFLKKAYSATLEQYHGWLGTQLFNVLSRFAPTRRQFLYTLALNKDNQEEIVIKDMQKYNQRLYATVERIIDFYNSNGLESAAIL